MAIYDFQGPSNLSALLGQGVGQGLGAGLEDILKNKMGQYQQQQELAHQQKQMAQLGEQYKSMGLNPAMAYAPPQVQQEMMKQQQRSQLATLLSDGQQMPQQAAQQPVQQAAPVKAEKNFEAERQRIAPLAAYDPNLYQREKARIDRAEIAEKKIALAKRQSTLAEEAVASKLFQPIRDAANAAREEQENVGTVAALLEKGDFSNPGLVAFYDFLPGGFLNALKSNDTKALESLRMSFMGNVKKYFGPQISDSDVREMYKSIISPTNTREQNQMLLKLAELKTTAPLLKEQVLNDVEEKYSDKSPYQIEKIVNKGYKEQLHDAVEKARELILPKLGNKIKTLPLASDIPKGTTKRFRKSDGSEIVLVGTKG